MTIKSCPKRKGLPETRGRGQGCVTAARIYKGRGAIKKKTSRGMGTHHRFPHETKLKRKKMKGRNKVPPDKATKNARKKAGRST